MCYVVIGKFLRYCFADEDLFVNSYAPGFGFSFYGICDVSLPSLQMKMKSTEC